jgi:hypothetical protein
VVLRAGGGDGEATVARRLGLGGSVAAREQVVEEQRWRAAYGGEVRRRSNGGGELVSDAAAVD